MVSISSTSRPQRGACFSETGLEIEVMSKTTLLRKIFLSHWSTAFIRGQKNITPGSKSEESRLQNL
jgi:hypothetical protein